MHPKDSDEAARFGELLALFGRQILEMERQLTPPDQPATRCTDQEWREYRMAAAHHWGMIEGLSMALVRVGEVQAGIYAALRKPTP
jgi:hypothetical protein